MISFNRARYAGFGSVPSDAGGAPVNFGGGSTLAGTMDSMALVISGNAGAPSGVENLIPLYSGGLCDAVKLIAPSAFRRTSSYEMAGVGAASPMMRGLIP